MVRGSIPGGRTLREEEEELPIPLTSCTTSKVSENLASAFISALDVYQNDGALVGPQAILSATPRATS